MDQRCERHERIFPIHEFCVDCAREQSVGEASPLPQSASNMTQEEWGDRPLESQS